MDSATDSSGTIENSVPEKLPIKAEPEAVSVPIKAEPNVVNREYEYNCVHCSVAHANHEALLVHLETCAANNNNTSNTPTDKNQETNNTSVAGKQSHMCMECGEILSTPYSLKRHTLTHTGHKPHKCQYCDRRYAHAYLLNHHLNTHAGDRPFRCTECGKDFTAPNMLRRHMQVHNKQVHRCQHCDQQFQRIDFLDKHLAKDHNVSRCHLCLVCGKSFTTEDMLEEHIETHNKSSNVTEDDLRCDICGNTFSRTSSLIRHKKQMHDSKEEQSPYFKAVEQPDVVFSRENRDQRDEKENAKTPKKETVVVCQLCNKSFARADSLKRHMIGVHQNTKNSDVPYEPILTFPESKTVVQNHVESSNHPCQQCGMQFTTEDLLVRHKAVVHPSDNKLEAELLLDILEKISKESNSGKDKTPEASESVEKEKSSTDATIKTEVGTIYCTACKTSFTDTNALENHIAVCSSKSKNEEGVEPAVVESPLPYKEISVRRKSSPGGKSRGRVKCEQCGKQFADNYCLKRHMISHTGEKKHTCEQCGKKFAHSFHLTSHRKIHLGIRDYRCDVCGKTFTVNHALQRHLLTHPSTIVHACIYCDRKFASESSMKKHQLTHIQ